MSSDHVSAGNEDNTVAEQNSTVKPCSNKAAINSIPVMKDAYSQSLQLKTFYFRNWSKLTIR